MSTPLPEQILTEAIAWCSAIGAIILVVFLVKDIIAVTKGEATWAKVIVKAVCLLCVIGFMYVAGSFEHFGTMFQNVFENVVTEENLPNIGQK